ncbi:uncharacterized protein LOC144879258 [Branchiostoma floridae x Branchiostoma japonicum]|uniref:NAD-dependent epimerase/dehydratase domain-containing protein n=1 Tax=Branchiostoma floridae TaxID=7739 RepID=C3ZB38_BRAFL|eukprot:XP_002594064.1 hypothetical protein BRAFLDRAFT_68496 [Branchiostoma floridae]
MTWPGLVLMLAATLARGGADGVRRRILVFGGNGFIGAATVEKLIQQGRNDVTIVNRGNWYWDSATRVKPHVQQVVCDRQKGVRACKELMSLVREPGAWFDAVIDFSCYSGAQMKQSLELLGNKAGLYVYISTDSVYEVCTKDHTGPTLETDDQRPTDTAEQFRLNRLDDYGNRKHEAEEVLRGREGLPWVFLRIPDVVGSRDGTRRWWLYQLWLRLHDIVPVHLPQKVANLDISLVQVEDVAAAISDILDGGVKVHNQAFNLAFKETLTLRRVLRDMGRQLGILNVNFNQYPEREMYLYPTVWKGPLSITKAEEYLQWSPVSWEEAVKVNCRFYESVMTSDQYVEEKTKLLQTFFSTFANDLTKSRAIADRLKKAYGIKLEDFVPWFIIKNEL